MADRLEQKELRKRRRERAIILALSLSFLLLTAVEFRLGKISASLPFVNSIFFFGLINFNIVILVGLLWLIFKNVGKIFFERRSQILGSRLKTKLVTAFIGFSIVPTLTVFTISALYINQSFDKWFSLKIQSTLQSSLEITNLYYRNAETQSAHFAELIAKQLRSSLISTRAASSNDLPGRLESLRRAFGRRQGKEARKLLDHSIASRPRREHLACGHFPRPGLGLRQSQPTPQTLQMHRAVLGHPRPRPLGFF
ncbi:MAG: hypothetical protein EBX52_12965, partial [Proteobacteria bacterium]|nr:hypothetical protein [Pseudomonadota bacterium]